MRCLRGVGHANACLELGQAPVLNLGDLIELAFALQFDHLRAQLLDFNFELGAALDRRFFGLQNFFKIGVLALETKDFVLD